MSSNSVKEVSKRRGDHAVIILASGLSQRLGQPKQLLAKNGEPLIVRMIRLAVSTNPQAIIVVIPDNHRLIASAITELANQYPAIQIVVNSQADTGMAHSLRLGIDSIAGLENSSINRVLIMGVDQVLLDESHLTALLAGEQSVAASRYYSWHSWQDLENYRNLNEIESNKSSAANKSTRNIVGLPLVINYKLLRQWKAALMGDKGLRHLIRGLPADQIDTVINDSLTYDIDTPEQLTYAKQQGWLDKKF
ncbi:nucleotidyltransferase family protein [Psychrobacter piscatorii]|uniref:nucleotidyltransferase family protein n=1 Tax=Psychrobacter piscatorii TaxID=554343 RepID=UPI00191935E1|nr:nucleotidyltransferase family protein [Psychrobacter piscatorii]